MVLIRRWIPLHLLTPQENRSGGLAFLKMPYLYTHIPVHLRAYTPISMRSFILLRTSKQHRW